VIAVIGPRAAPISARKIIAASLELSFGAPGQRQPPMRSIGTEKDDPRSTFSALQGLSPVDVLDIFDPRRMVSVVERQLRSRQARKNRLRGQFGVPIAPVMIVEPVSQR
jgi:hypothetical protein